MFFEQFIPNFEERLKQKRCDAWGDHVDIMAISELFDREIQILVVDCLDCMNFVFGSSNSFCQTVSLIGVRMRVTCSILITSVV